MNSAAFIPEIYTYHIPAKGDFPNNDKLPVMIYKKAFLDLEVNPAIIEDTFNEHKWYNPWRDGIFPYHHYHSNTHEVLGIYSGWIEIQLGGPEGIRLTVQKGDVLILPAGMAHKNIRSSEDFRCIGAYPNGKEYDMNYGNPEEKEKALKNIAQVTIPEQDPLLGLKGGILVFWKKPNHY